MLFLSSISVSFHFDNELVIRKATLWCFKAWNLNIYVVQHQMCLFCGEATVDNLIIEKEQQVHILVTLYNQRVLFFWKQVRISQFLLTSLGKNLIAVVITTNTGPKKFTVFNGLRIVNRLRLWHEEQCNSSYKPLHDKQLII